MCVRVILYVDPLQPFARGCGLMNSVGTDGTHQKSEAENQN